MKKILHQNDSGFVVTCRHILFENKPIAFAHRDHIYEEGDSGWQFLCGGGHNLEEAKLVTMDEIMKFDSGIKSFISEPAGCKFRKDFEINKWKGIKVYNSFAKTINWLRRVVFKSK